ncbi:MAG: hypothetical protein HN478_05960 [Rhodospirillaceae bacterium]|nr:hypothetical protein [Rhodospirillaceae bacterium]MBT4487404.1 hypothetical protein [Rhodospirillaceae bacterium]MBT5193583.1 hypothetical protein [Rhodospirillaceae bacterium]MBT5896889.1 hypothetical protein [Rhodospirillaceae bacterium]MBT6431379.1 hypothetical protein [Rhodospirillaceae bacterium]
MIVKRQITAGGKAANALWWRKIGRFGQEGGGAVALVFALLVMPLLALAGLAVDVGFILSAQAQMRGEADAAALAAASVASDSDEAESRALAITELNLPAADHGDVLVSADVEVGNWDEDTRAFTANGTPVNAARVTVRKTASNGNAFDLTFGGIVSFSSIDIETIAVATSSGSGGTACALALSSSAKGAIDVGGNAVVAFNSCDVAANSDDDDALEVGGSATLDANCASIVGGTDAASPEFDLTCGAAETGTSATADPYSGLPDPTVGNCIDTNYKNTSGTDTLSAGTYCGKFEITGGTVELGSGTYVIDDGNFSVNGGATLKEVDGGTGVTIILTDSDGDSPGSVTINGGAIVTLAAPTSGDYSGVVFYQDKDAASTTKNKFNGGSTTNFTGALYFPNEAIEFTGGNTTGGSTCTQVIAQTIDFTGNSTLNSSCDSAGTTPILITSSSHLVQ